MLNVTFSSGLIAVNIKRNNTVMKKDELPADTQRQHDVVSTSMRRDDVASTSVRRYFDIMCLLEGVSFNKTLKF